MRFILSHAYLRTKNPVSQAIWIARSSELQALDLAISREQVEREQVWIIRETL